jgi:hypothetical protein
MPENNLRNSRKRLGFDAVVSKDTPFPVVGIIETLNTRTRHDEAVPTPAPASLANAVPVRAAEVVPAALTKSLSAPVTDAKRGLPSSLRADEHPDPKRISNEGGAVQG